MQQNGNEEQARTLTSAPHENNPVQSAFSPTTTLPNEPANLRRDQITDLSSQPWQTTPVPQVNSVPSLASPTMPASESGTAPTTTDNAAFPSRTVRMPDQVKMEKSKVAPGYYRPVPEQTLIEWDAPARPYKKRSRQFFTTILVIAILICLVLFFSYQFLPVAVVISAVFLIYVTAVIPPHIMHYKLTNYGLYIEKEAYAWYEMLRFWFDEKSGQQVVNIDLLRFPNRLTMVILADQTPTKEDFDLVFSEVILKEKPQLTTYEKVAQWLQDKIPLE